MDNAKMKCIISLNKINITKDHVIVCDGFQLSPLPILRSYKTQNSVDTLFKVKGIYVHFSLYGRDRNFIETRIIERFVIFQHTVNSVN